MAAEPGLMAEVEAEFARARDMSETRTLADLRDAVGAGHDDLMEVIGELQDGGRISEVAPGEYMRADPRGEHVPARRDHSEGEPGISLAEAERRLDRAGPVRATMKVTPGSENRTVLSKGVARALDAETLGALVKAGIDEAIEEGRAFVFEVAP